MEPLFSVANLPAPSMSWQGPNNQEDDEEEKQLADFDLDVLFDDDQQAASGSPVVSQNAEGSTMLHNEIPVIPEVTPSTTPPSTSARSVSVSTADGVNAIPTSLPTGTTASDHLLMTPPTTTDTSFVNVYMVFDPARGSFVCPDQLLSFQTNGGEVKTAAIGPNSLVNSQIEAMLKLTSASALTTANHNFTNPLSKLVPQEPLLLPPKTSGAVVPSSPTTVVTATPPTSATPSPTSVSPLLPLSSEQGSSAVALPLKRKRACTRKSKSPPQPPAGIVTATAELPPLRALSAYNFFFRDERDRILNDDKRPVDCSEDRQLKLLHDHWGRDRTLKRRHRKTHGKIDFTTLSRLISSRWKKLPNSKKEFYRQTAALDFARYQNETSLAHAVATNTVSKYHQSVVG